jgi:hypothetical protein
MRTIALLVTLATLALAALTSAAAPARAGLPDSDTSVGWSFGLEGR